MGEVLEERLAFGIGRRQWPLDRRTNLDRQRIPARLLSGLTDDAEPHTPVVITKEEAVPLVGLTSDERQADLGAEGANTDPRYGLRQRRGTCVGDRVVDTLEARMIFGPHQPTNLNEFFKLSETH